MSTPDDRLKAVFDQAAEVADPGARAVFLDRACAGDAALRERVEALLRAHDAAGSFLAHPPAAGADTTSSDRQSEARTTDWASTTPETGAVVGPYKLVEEIGEGGMGTVYLAQQTEPVRRLVAIKLVKAGMDSRQVLARFEAERQALALMDHPNIAKVLDAGAAPDGRPYFVMELVKGTPITQHCDEHRLGVRDRLALFADVCRAVQHAHQKGIIHRDIKPSNVLVAPYDGKSVVKVIDFGIAKATGQPLTERTLVTGIGAVVGTPEYMSPEQAELNNADIDTRSDIYSLGVVLYELLTGTTPLTRKRLKDVALLEVLRVIREEEPPKPSTRLSTMEELPSIAAARGVEPARLSRLVRGELDWIVMKALEKDRNRRYESANGFAVDVQRYLNDEPVQACTPSAWYRLRKFARRHRAALWLSAAGVMVLLLAASGVGWVLWDRSVQRTELAGRLAETERTVSHSLTKAEDARDRAAGMPTATSQQAAEALVVWRQAEDRLAQAQAALDTGAATDELRQRVEDLRQQIERGRQHCERQKDRALRKEKLLRDLDEARLRQFAWVGGRLGFRGAAARYARVFADYGLEIRAERAEEVVRRIRAEDPEVRDALIVALDCWRDFSSLADPGYWEFFWEMVLAAIAGAADDDAWRQKCRAAITRGGPAALRILSDEARRLSVGPSRLELLARHLNWAGQRDQALALMRWGHSRYHTDFWLAFQLGAALARQKEAHPTPVELEEAIGCYRTALAVRPTIAAVHYNLGVALMSKNQRDEAIAEYREAIRLDPEHAMAHTNLGNALLTSPARLQAGSTGQLAKSQLNDAILNEAIGEFRAAMKLDPKQAAAHNGLGAALVEKNQIDEAIAEFLEATKIEANSASLLYDPGRALARAYYNLGNVLERRERYDEAIRCYSQAARSDPNLFEAHSALGEALADRAPKDAVKAFQRAIKLKPDDVWARSGLAQALRNDGKPQEAMEANTIALELWRKLAAAEPRNAEYLSRVGATLNNLAMDLPPGKKSAAAAVPLLEEAIVYQKAARLIDPDHPRYRLFLRNHYGILADALIQLDKHVEAARAVAELPALYPDGLKEHVQAAGILARCAALAANDDQLSPAKRKQAADGYSERAVTLLRQAVDKGWKNAAALKDRSFEPLRSRDDFQKLQVELEMKSKP
jgi:serine/threonine protein kinase/predicted Zn-dependent protease